MEEKKDAYDTYLKILFRASSDDSFREKLKSHPVETLEKEMGEKFPNNFTIKVVEPDPDYSLTFMVPTENMSMKETDLDNVAGGFGLIPFFATLIPSVLPGVMDLFSRVTNGGNADSNGNRTKRW